MFKALLLALGLLLAASALALEECSFHVHLVQDCNFAKQPNDMGILIQAIYSQNHTELWRKPTSIPYIYSLNGNGTIWSYSFQNDLHYTFNEYLQGLFPLSFEYGGCHWSGGTPPTGCEAYTPRCNWGIGQAIISPVLPKI